MPSRALRVSALVGIFQVTDTSQIKAMARPGGNPNFLKVRNTDTSAANAARQTAADMQALQVFDWTLEALDKGCTTLAECITWLNNHEYYTRGKKPKPWSDKTYRRALKRLGRRKLISLYDARKLLGLFK